MDYPLDLRNRLALSIRGKIGTSGAWNDYIKPGIYQMRKTLNGKQPVRLSFYTADNPQTPAQQANRAKISAAVSDWQDLTETQKNSWRYLARGRRFSGYNLFIKKHLNGEI